MRGIKSCVCDMILSLGGSRFTVRRHRNLRESARRPLTGFHKFERETALERNPPERLTAMLVEARAGDAFARDRLMQAVYGELRQMADMMMRRERPDHTLQPSAACERGVSPFAGRRRPSAAQDRRYLFAAAAQAMRQVLVDHARAGARSNAMAAGNACPWTKFCSFLRIDGWMSWRCMKRWIG